MNPQRFSREQKVALQMLNDACGGLMPWVKKYQVAADIVIQHYTRREKS
jgi:N-acyl-D-aspartate/D-glutamate deacylase